VSWVPYSAHGIHKSHSDLTSALYGRPLSFVYYLQTLSSLVIRHDALEFSILPNSVYHGTNNHTSDSVFYRSSVVGPTLERSSTVWDEAMRGQRGTNQKFTNTTSIHSMCRQLSAWTSHGRCRVQKKNRDRPWRVYQYDSSEPAFVRGADYSQRGRLTVV
jgi:hypothetical protein